MIVYRLSDKAKQEIAQKGEKKARFVPGVKREDLDEVYFAALPGHLKIAVAASDLYEKVATEPVEPVDAAAVQPDNKKKTVGK